MLETDFVCKLIQCAELFMRALLTQNSSVAMFPKAPTEDWVKKTFLDVKEKVMGFLEGLPLIMRHRFGTMNRNPSISQYSGNIANLLSRRCSNHIGRLIKLCLLFFFGTCKTLSLFHVLKNTSYNSTTYQQLKKAPLSTVPPTRNLKRHHCQQYHRPGSFRADYAWCKK